jgi:hypothetical protein
MASAVLLSAPPNRRAPSSGLQPGALTASQQREQTGWPLGEHSTLPQTALPVMAITKMSIGVPPVNRFTVAVRPLRQGGRTSEWMGPFADEWSEIS